MSFRESFNLSLIIWAHGISEDEEETQYEMVQGEFLALNGGDAQKINMKIS